MKAKIFSKSFVLFFLIIFFSLIVRLYKISEIPGEWFGDISNVHEYTQAIMKGEWPFYFFQSPGPLYHYAVAPVVFLFSGHGYNTYKIASILLSILGIYGTYLLVREWFTKRIALISVWLVSFSFWPLVWARLGNSQVVIPVILSFALYFFVRYTKKKNVISLLLSGIISSLGWYTYPQTFIFVPIFLLSYLGYFKITRQMKKRMKEIIFIFLILIIGFLPFLNIVKSQPYNFGKEGYIGGKVIPVFLMDPKKAVFGEFSNFSSTLNMFFLKGDSAFRVNVAESSIIDKLSFVFLILGILYFIVHKKYLEILFLFFLTCLLILPATLPGTLVAEIPSNSRTISIQPIVFLLISLGIVFCASLLKKKYMFHNLFIGGLVACGIIISYLNLNKYFVLYSENLPDGNLAPGKKIAQYLDQQVSSTTAVYFASCCWMEWGEPEPKAVAYVIRKPRSYIGIADIVDCSGVDKLPALIIFGPNDKKGIEDFAKCFTDPVIKAVQVQNSQILFIEMTVAKRKAVASNQPTLSF